MTGGRKGQDLTLGGAGAAVSDALASSARLRQAVESAQLQASGPDATSMVLHPSPLAAAMATSAAAQDPLKLSLGSTADMMRATEAAQSAFTLAAVGGQAAPLTLGMAASALSTASTAAGPTDELRRMMEAAKTSHPSPGSISTALPGSYSAAQAAADASRAAMAASSLAGATSYPYPGITLPAPTTRIVIAPPIRGESAPKQPTASQTPIASVADVGRLVRDARKRMGLTQQRFADLAGVGRRFVSELEAGKSTLEFGKVITVCNAAGVKLLAGSR